ncbi:MAG: 4Fe-4S binding protein [Bacilli bacterium]|jgi:ferredoxin|nr:4Fe-4S binding protein [Bacilli bacterium]
MNRTIIEIDETKCIGCGLCANTCHQNAIQIINGKAKLVNEDYCDGLGKCLPNCPTNAIKLINKDSNTIINNINETWPIQIRLLLSNNNYLNKETIVIAADCTAFTYPDFFNKFIKDNTCIIGCPKLDDYDYINKFKEIITINNNIKNIELVIMEVFCCSNLKYFIEQAIKEINSNIKLKTTIISIDQKIKED